MCLAALGILHAKMVIRCSEGSGPHLKHLPPEENRRKELEFHLEEGLERNTWGRIGYPKTGWFKS